VSGWRDLPRLLVGRPPADPALMPPAEKARRERELREMAQRARVAEAVAELRLQGRR
jgi:hypothetical protein